MRKTFRTRRRRRSKREGVGKFPCSVAIVGDIEPAKVCVGYGNDDGRDRDNHLEGGTDKTHTVTPLHTGILSFNDPHQHTSNISTLGSGAKGVSLVIGISHVTLSMNAPQTQEHVIFIFEQLIKLLPQSKHVLD